MDTMAKKKIAVKIIFFFLDEDKKKCYIEASVVKKKNKPPIMIEIKCFPGKSFHYERIDRESADASDVINYYCSVYNLSIFHAISNSSLIIIWSIVLDSVYKRFLYYLQSASTPKYREKNMDDKCGGCIESEKKKKKRTDIQLLGI